MSCEAGEIEPWACMEARARRGDKETDGHLKVPIGTLMRGGGLHCGPSPALTIHRYLLCYQYRLESNTTLLSSCHRIASIPPFTLATLRDEIVAVRRRAYFHLYTSAPQGLVQRQGGSALLPLPSCHCAPESRKTLCFTQAPAFLRLIRTGQAGPGRTSAREVLHAIRTALTWSSAQRLYCTCSKDALV